MSPAPLTTTEPAVPEFRAGGTDVSERRRSGVSRGPLQDLPPDPEMTGIVWTADGSARIGALTLIAAIAADAKLASAYPGLAAAAGGLATPQIRRVATLGGNVAQRTRCAYYRQPHIACLKKGGTTCPARAGHHLGGTAFDLSACVAPHPSTMAAALLAYDATVTTTQRDALGIADVLGDGADGRADHALAEGEIIRSIALRLPMAGERAAYQRAISRTHAEWPLVEVVARVFVSGGRIEGLRLAAGGIAARPMRLLAAEQAAVGQPANAATIARAAAASLAGAKPLPQTGYKLALLQGLVQDMLERLVA